MNLSHPADRRTLALLTLLTICLVAAWHTGSLLWLPPCTLLCLTACCAKHNHIHRAIFRRRWLNRFLDFWLTLLTGSTTAGIRVAHRIRHHGGNQTPEDFVRCHQVRTLPPLRALAWYVPRVILASWGESRRDFRPLRRLGLRHARRQEAALLWTVILGGLIVDPFRFLLFPGVPWGLSQWFLIAVNLPQHDGCDPAGALNHSRNCTGRLTNWLLLNNGYHSVHHDAPGCHWSDLPHLHSAALAQGLPPRLDCPSFAAFWLNWWHGRRKEAQP